MFFVFNLQPVSQAECHGICRALRDADEWFWEVKSDIRFTHSGQIVHYPVSQAIIPPKDFKPALLSHSSAWLRVRFGG